MSSTFPSFYSSLILERYPEPYSPTLVPPTPPHASPVGDRAVYLASRFARRDEMMRVAADLQCNGYEVTSRWLTSKLAIGPGELDTAGRAADLAMMDLEDVQRAHICLAFTEPPEETKPGRGGRHTELGIALALGLRVVLVGPREHVFHCLPSIEQYPCWQDARAALLQASEAVAA